MLLSSRAICTPLRQTRGSVDPSQVGQYMHHRTPACMSTSDVSAPRSSSAMCHVGEELVELENEWAAAAEQEVEQALQGNNWRKAMEERLRLTKQPDLDNRSTLAHVVRDVVSIHRFSVIFLPWHRRKVSV